MKSVLYQRTGIALFLLAFAPLIYYLVLSSAHNWKPLQVPVVLTNGDFRSSAFKTDMNGRYLISLVFDEQKDLSRQQCLMGVVLPQGRCRGISSQLDFAWTVVAKDGSIMQSGEYQPGSVSGSEVDFASFLGKRGQKQQIVLNIRRDASELNAAGPKLMVQVGPEYWEGLPELFGFSMVFAGVVGFLGLICTLLPTLARVLKPAV